ncbi:MAG: FAD-binding protein, partial [Dehalococcoidia bacterium]|nr:FAD-binding protein [Dehalococcoidia bacterium]
GGGAGLRAAIAARQSGAADVVLASKSRPGYGNNTAIAGGAFAAAAGWRDPQDIPHHHLRDTVIGGRFINNQALVATVAGGGKRQVLDFQAFGVKFRRDSKEGLYVARAPGHSYAHHVYGENRIGTDFTLPLRAQADRDGVKFMEGVFVTRLLQRAGRVVGAMALDRDAHPVVINAVVTVLACGGLGQLYLHTNNAAGTTADGYALAYHAGLTLRDMEFVQFYPTALGELGSRNLIYEAFVFNGGAIIRNSQGEDVRVRHGLQDPMVFTRDRFTRALMTEILEGRATADKLTMDLTPVPPETLAKLTPLLPREERERRQFPVAPTAHFAMGGLDIDTDSHTALPGLLACGEVCGGVHGANRLAGNALTEVFVFGTIAGEEAAHLSAGTQPDSPEGDDVLGEVDRLRQSASGQTGQSQQLRRALKQVMWDKVGVIRDHAGLQGALAEIASLNEAVGVAGAACPRELVKLLEMDYMLTTAEMVCRAALKRSESRGAHFRTDSPQEDNQGWLKNITIRRRGSQMEMDTVPVALTEISPE